MLPKDLDKAFFEENTYRVLEDIAKEYSLDLEKQKELGSELGLYMLGKTKKDRFVPNIMYRLDVNRSTAEAIAEKINREIIDNVRASFEMVQSEDYLASSGINVVDDDRKDVPTANNNPVEPVTESRSEIMSGVQNPLHTKEKEDVDTEDTEQKDEYSNYSPLNMVKEDVIDGIEHPFKEEPVSPENAEGTKLDMQLDELLKGPRVVPEIPDNLPKYDGRDQTIAIKSKIPTEPEIKKPTMPVAEPQKVAPAPQKRIPPNYKDGGDPYREPIE